jgi:exopolysaccharide biosynthesis protein
MAHRGVVPTRFPNDVELTRSPRTALGIDRDGQAMLAVFDGRADMPHSTGLTLGELAHTMRGLGCVDALNLDGGGSSALLMPGLDVPGLGEEIAPGIVNRPADLGGIDRVLPWPLALWAP